MQLTNPVHIRILRYAVGLTISIALAFGIAWPLSFLFPILSAVMLAMPLPKPSLAQGIGNMRNTLFAFGVAFIVTQFIHPHTVIYIPILGLLLFHVYYHLNRGGSFWLVLMLLLDLLIMPMLSGVNEGLAIGVIFGLVTSSCLTILLLWLAHYLVPDLPGAQAMPRQAQVAPGYQSGYSAPAAEAALKSTIVVFPVVIILLANNMTGLLLVMIFTAMFTLSPDLAKGKEASMNSIMSTLIGGIVAFFVYWALVAVPEYYFFILIMFALSLIFGIGMNSKWGMAKYLASAMTAVILLVSSSLAEGADFFENFVMRMLLILLATIYVVMALKVLDAFWPKNEVVSSQPAVL